MATRLLKLYKALYLNSETRMRKELRLSHLRNIPYTNPERAGDPLFRIFCDWLADWRKGLW